jgi:hypothetical protein
MRSIAAVVLLCACASNKPMPTSVAVAVPDDGSKVIFAGNAEGAQVYGCNEGAWKLKAPDAVVDGKVKHYAGPTWEAPDGSKVVAEVKAKADVDGASIPWLLLRAKSTEGEGLLAHARWIQRLETKGGKAPAAACEAGAELRVPYTAVYRIWGD